ncbi:AzlD domain-containing protein [Paucilactobacillus kaifaensis]|uniref:AzlD domain-containing protein n=1 Tax=Paucilactobacillus kaifaensis TaxID=2559921 RepID=UPI0010F4E4CA|nr:AzlD domain-containing protein [Paucilactobacillus kaifaensis]
MGINTYILLTILGCGLVTWLSRVIPFILVKNFVLPTNLIKLLSFVPVAIMTALVIQNILIFKIGSWPSVNWLNFGAAIPTIISAFISKSLLIIVIIGIISMALLRFIL